MTKHKILGVAIASLFATTINAENVITNGEWNVTVEDDNTMTVSYGDKVILNKAYASVTYNILGSDTEKTISSEEGAIPPTIAKDNIDDCFGKGVSYTLTYRQDGGIMTQTINFYESLPYMIVQVSIASEDGTTVQSRRLTALGSNTASRPLEGASNRMLYVPFDNDGNQQARFTTAKLDEENFSHEATAVFNPDSRKGIVFGSVDHDTWKSLAYVNGKGGYDMTAMECRSGYTDILTRDVLPHGKVKGQTVSSARFLFGMFDDWRDGMDMFADACIAVAPRPEWKNGNPMGWSTWGSMKEYVTFDGVIESAHFIKDELYDKGFHDNNGQTVISIDAFGTDNISNARFAAMGTKYFGEGDFKDGKVTGTGTNQILGQYGGFFVVWDWALGSTVEGSQYTNRDIALRINGEVKGLASNGGHGCPVDPTHPGVAANIRRILEKWSKWNVKYIKIDFLNCGIVEGDSWYNPEITTGVQAYNYGMRILREEAEKYGMYIVESISPLFPYNYAHGRRVYCDTFSEIGESENVMTAITGGWWTSRLYTVNDPDQLVFYKRERGTETEGENRARATTGMVTGAYIFGDNFSDKVVYNKEENGHAAGDVVGWPDKSKEMALRIMGNEDVNEYVRNNTGSFRPVEVTAGSSASTSLTSLNGAAKIYMKETPEYWYVAVFNFANKYIGSTLSGSISFDRLGIDAGNVGTVKELWLNEEVTMSDTELSYNVPKADARIYRISKKIPDVDGIKEIETEPVNYNVVSEKAFDLQGRAITPATARGIFVVRQQLANGSYVTKKVMK